MPNRSKCISNSIAFRIRILRQKFNLTQKELGEKLFKSESTIRMWELGKSEPDLQTIKQLSEIFNTTSDYILNGDTEFTSLESYGIRGITKKRFPMLGEIACGQPIFAEQDFESFVDAVDEIDADFCLTARGDSMIEARIKDGDVVFIKQMPIVQNGEIAAVIIDGEATLKKWFYYPEKQKLVLNPANQNYEPLVYIGAELDTIICLGKAVCYMSKL